jgi:hypothetical protein
LCLEQKTMFVVPVNPQPQRPSYNQSILCGQRYDHITNRILPLQRFQIATTIDSRLEDILLLGILEEEMVRDEKRRKLLAKEKMEQKGK